jgi:arylsulfatase A-like enzyme
MARPNLLLFMTDQQRWDSIGAFGNPAASTPHIDALAERGTRFAQAWSQHSACSQSRISMMTGWYPHVAGHRTLDHLLQPWEPNVLATLRDAGYHVAWAGIRGDTFAPGVTAASTDFFGFTVRPSLDAIAGAHAIHFPLGHPLRHAHYAGRLEGRDLLTFDEAAVRTAIELLTDGMPEPWVLYLTLFAPHPPFAIEEPWYSLHDRRDMPEPLPPGSGKPDFMAALRDESQLDRLDAADWAEITATYYGMVSRLDDQLGRVQRAIEQVGASERTITCFFTDHGEYLGDFGLVEKWPSGLDPCLVRNPLIVAGPGIAEGAVCDGLVEMVDLPATLCELAGTEPAHVQFGRSLLPLLRDATKPHRAFACSEGGFRLDEEPQNEQADDHPYALKARLQHDRPELVGRAVAIRTPDWTYVRRTHEDDELYDRRADPHETANVLADPTNEPVVSAMTNTLLDWIIETSDVIPRDRDPRMEPAILDQFLT